MERKIPGTIKIEGRKFIYIQSADVNEFEYSFDNITEGDIEQPSSGAMISGNAIIQLPNKNLMFSISYKGDLEGWERNILEYCASSNLIYGEIAGEELVLSNNQHIPLKLCTISFY